MEKLRVGVIGLGIGRAHIRGFGEHEGAEVVAIADPNKERLLQAKTEYAIQNTYESASEMLAQENLDVVSVATPNAYHCELTIEALKAGCHVLCEKPMALHAKEAEKMLVAAKKHDRRLMINFSYRFTQQSWALKQEVDRGTLGEIYFARSVWHRRRGMPGFGGWFGQKKLAGGGPLIDLGVHRLDLALWLMGYPQPVWVLGSTYDPIATRIAKASGKEFDVEDLAAGFVKFDNGATLVIEASWAANIKEREHMLTRLLGTKGGLVQRNVGEGYDFEAELFVDHDGTLFDMKLHPPVPEVKSSMHHFADCIIKNKPHIATGDEGLIVMELLDAIYESASKGEPVKIEPPAI